MIRRLVRSLDSRLGLARFVRSAMNHVFPDHWSFMLGEIALYSFVILVITGTFLAMFYNGSSDHVIYHGAYGPLNGVRVSAAFQSILHITFDVRGGLLVRQMHHWAALIFVAAIVTHMARIFFTAAFRRPREINWLIGVTLLLLAIVNGFAGYSIGGDLLSGVGLRVGYSIMLSVPVIGEWLTFLLLGGRVPTSVTVPRLYALHIFVIPAAIAALIALHVSIIWRQMHTNYPGPHRTDRSIVGSRLWPSYAAKSIGLFCLLFAAVAALGGLVQINPLWVYGPYDPTSILPGSQPDWYLGWVEGAMRLFPGLNIRQGFLVPDVFFPAVLLPAFTFGLLYLYPFFDKLIYYDRTGRNRNVLRLPYQQPFNTAFGCAAFVFFLVLLFAGGDDVIAVVMNSRVVDIRTALRILALIAPPLTFAAVYLLCRRARRRNETPPPPPVPESPAVPIEVTREPK